MGIHNPPFFPTFGAGAPPATAPREQLWFDTSGGEPFQGYVFDFPLAAWKKFGGGAGTGFPTKENLATNNAAPINAGNVNIHYITTDGSGLAQSINLPTPPADATGAGSSAFWFDQWSVFVISVQTNPADSVLINSAAPFTDLNAFHGQNINTANYNDATFTMQGQGKIIAFRWTGTSWAVNNDGANNGLSVNTNNNIQIGPNGVGNATTHKGQDIFIGGVNAFPGSTANGGIIQIIAGTGASGLNSQPGTLTLKAGDAVRGSGSSGGNITIQTQVGDTTDNALVNSGAITISSAGMSGIGNASGSIGIITGDLASANNNQSGNITIRTGGVAGVASNGPFSGSIIIGPGNNLVTVAGTSAPGGAVLITGGSTQGTGAGTPGTPGNVVVTGGQASSQGPVVNAGNVIIQGGQGVGPCVDGNVVLYVGNSNNAANGGNIIINKLPVADPAVVNAIWNNNGVIVLSGFTGIPPTSLASQANNTLLGNVSGGAHSPAAVDVPHAQVLLGGAYQLLIARGVNFNAVADTQFALTPPTGFTRWTFTDQSAFTISNPSGTLTTSVVQAFSQAAGAGTAYTASTAVTVSTAADGTVNNSQAISGTAATTKCYTYAGFPNIFFRVTTAQGVAATADVAVRIKWLP